METDTVFDDEAEFFINAGGVLNKVHLRKYNPPLGHLTLIRDIG